MNFLHFQLKKENTEASHEVQYQIKEWYSKFIQFNNITMVSNEATIYFGAKAHPNFIYLSMSHLSTPPHYIGFIV